MPLWREHRRHVLRQQRRPGWHRGDPRRHWGENGLHPRPTSPAERHCVRRGSSARRAAPRIDSDSHWGRRGLDVLDSQLRRRMERGADDGGIRQLRGRRANCARGMTIVLRYSRNQVVRSGSHRIRHGRGRRCRRAGQKRPAANQAEAPGVTHLWPLRPAQPSGATRRGPGRDRPSMGADVVGLLPLGVVLQLAIGSACGAVPENPLVRHEGEDHRQRHQPGTRSPYSRANMKAPTTIRTIWKSIAYSGRKDAIATGTGTFRMKPAMMARGHRRVIGPCTSG